MMETNRIILRPWRDSDAETLYKWASDPDVGPRAWLQCISSLIPAIIAWCYWPGVKERTTMC